MNFFGGNNCNDMTRENFGGMDCCSLIFLLLILQNCGCGFMKDGINIDCKTIMILLLISNCFCNK